MTSSETSVASMRRSQQVLCASLMSSLVVILMAVAFTLGSAGTGSAPVCAYAVVAAVAVGQTALIGSFGYRIDAIAPGTPEEDARTASVAALQRTTILRFALAESVALVALALAFVVDEGGLFVLALGVLAAEALMVVHVWPSERVVRRTQEALERDGARSYFREALDSPPPAR